MHTRSQNFDRQFDRLLAQARKDLIGRWIRNDRDTGTILDVYMSTERGVILLVDLGDGGQKEVHPRDIREW